MLVLDIRANLGSGARLREIEQVVRGIRVATDVAYDAETRRVRRAVTERMKHPTDRELQDLRPRGPRKGDEQSPWFRAEQQLAARNFFRKEAQRFTPEFFEYFYRRQGDDAELPPSIRRLYDAGYNRLIGTGFLFPDMVGLDVLDPVLYDSLVADQLARSAPEAVRVRSFNYENPIWATLFGKGSAEKTVSATAEVLKVVRDFGPTRTVGKAEAAVAKATVENRIAESDLDLEMKREKLAEARLLNERLALDNERAAQALSADQQRRNLIELAIRRGQLDVADALRALSLADAQALDGLGRRPLAIEEYTEQNDPEV